ncbi:MAG: PLP-dependent aminotransferase family protein [Deltaproteobacteria bacterium]|nr:MAG: PLP-dependent aminotransferase family protein [Deltaproteobacteria bacterium]
MARFSAQELFSPPIAKLNASAIREICKLISRPQLMSLAGGWPDPQTFPVEQITAIVSDVLRENAALALQYTSSEGLPELRQWLCEWMKRRDGIACGPEQVLVTHGSAQGMELVAKALLSPGDVAIVGLPTYFGGPGACRSFGAELVGVPVDDNGMDTDALEATLGRLREVGRRAKLVYVIPDFQNPTGATMPVERRKRLVELASEYDLVVVEDSPYRDLCYDGSPPPPVKSFDGEGRVMYLRSFSKIFCPGFRLGLAVGDETLVRKMVIARQFEDCCTAAFGQYVLFEFCKRGLLDRQIESNIGFYRQKRDILLDALGRYFPRTVSWNRPSGGFFVWVRLREGLDAEELLRKSVSNDVAFVAGRPFFIDGSGSNTMRLSFAQEAPERMTEAVKRLSDLLW